MTEKEWLDNFNRGVPDKYSILVCGWPDEAHGIDHAAYLAACQAALDIVEDGKDAPVFLKFKEWKEQELEKNEVRVHRENAGAAPTSRRRIAMRYHYEIGTVRWLRHTGGEIRCHNPPKGWESWSGQALELPASVLAGEAVNAQADAPGV